MKYALTSPLEHEGIQAAFAFVEDHFYDKKLWVNNQPDWNLLNTVFNMAVTNPNVLPVTKLAMVRIAHGAAHVKQFPAWAKLRDQCIVELGEKVCAGLQGLEHKGNQNVI